MYFPIQSQLRLAEENSTRSTSPTGNVTGAATVAYWAITDAFGADVTPSRRLNERESVRGCNLAGI